MFTVFVDGLRCARLAFGLLCVMMFARTADASFDTFSVGGNATTASIQPTIDTFRAALGDPNNGNAAGPLAGGRREINWDGGGSPNAAPVGTPMTTFQNNRGATLTTPGTGFLQTPLNASELTSINATYETEFGTFSALRIFTPLASNITDVTFSLPGSNGGIPATVAGFGAVFSDVDTNATQIEFFDLGDNSIFVTAVPSTSVSDAGLSFFGALANAGEQIARVRITTGNTALGPDDQGGDPVDVVVMDDFLYAEPLAVPEPSATALAALGLASLMIRKVRVGRKMKG